MEKSSFTATTIDSISARATGVDLSVTNSSYGYANSADEAKFRMFSSNFPIIGFNKPYELFVIDTMVNAPTKVTIEVENFGTNPSGTIDINIKLLHNEYTQFEIVNDTIQMASLNGGTSNNIQHQFTPTYSGNHTIWITATSSIADDNTNNDIWSKGFAVGSQYYNCDMLTSWTVGNLWSSNTDASISNGKSCHVGSGSSSTYNNGMQTSLITPAIDLSDAVEAPTRTNGITFFYSGSAAVNDYLKVYSKNTAGGWNELATISGTIDNNFADGSNWQTFSVSNKGFTSPLIPVPQADFHSQSQFKFEFYSDASGVDIGYWVDDIVILYDQKVKHTEYSLSSTGVTTTGSLPGDWGSVRVEVSNDGNITDSFIPSVIGLPTDWQIYYAHTNGIALNPTAGVALYPGESKQIDLKIMPGQNESTGFTQMTFKAYSTYYNEVNTTLPVQFQVLADRVPLITGPEQRPNCPPGNTCTFAVLVENIGAATDVFDLTIDQASLASGWQVGLEWTQASSILVRPDTPVQVYLTMTLPNDCAPDTISTFKLTATSQNDSRRFHEIEIDISASMISNASVEVTNTQSLDSWIVDAGETKTISFTITNHATRQDIFEMSVQSSGSTLWIVEQPTRPNAVINSGASTTFTIEITAPANAQAGDNGPSIIPIITSTRSGMTFMGADFNELEVESIEDIVIRLVDSPLKLTPGIGNKIEIEIENDGNGPTQVVIDLPNLPDSWQWWMRLSDQNHTGPIDLSASYDLQDIKIVEVWILISMEESAGIMHSIEITAMSNSMGTDINPSDNLIEINAITASHKQPKITNSSSQIGAMADSTTSASITIQNIGNAVDNQISVRVIISSSPPVPGIIGFFSVGSNGGALPIDGWSDITLNGGEQTTLNVDMILPKEIPLNTRIIVRFEVVGGLDEELRPYELEHEAMILVDSRRSMTTSSSPISNATNEFGISVPLWINLTSTSTMEENYIITSKVPDGWQVVCLGILMNESGYPVHTPAGHIDGQEKFISCDIHRLSGSLEGQIEITVISQDGTLSWHDKQSIYFQSQIDDSFSAGTDLLVAGGLAVLVFIALIAVLIRKRSTDISADEETVEEREKVFISPTVGPPASQVSGPPVSQQQPEPIPLSVNATDQPANAPSGPPSIESFSTPQEIQPVEQIIAGPQVPESGLPVGWSEEQWHHYGQQYLDGTL
jgi:uncharacterized membrane protein